MSQAIEYHRQLQFTSHEMEWRYGWLAGNFLLLCNFDFIFVVVSVVLPFFGINKQNHALSVFIPYMDWIYQIRAYRNKWECEWGMGKQLSISSSWVGISSLRSVELFIFYKQKTYLGLCRSQHEVVITMLLWKKSRRASCRSKSASVWC